MINQNLQQKFRTSSFVRLLYNWIKPVVDPMRLMYALPGYIRLFIHWHRYSRLPGAEPVRLLYSQPVLGQATGKTGYDSHYVHQAVWASKRIMAVQPDYQVDVGSDHRFVTLLTPHLPVIFIDFCPLMIEMLNLMPVAGNVLELPLATDSIPSLSCLHVAEHVGLGRYGGPLDPQGTKKAARELARVIAPNGNLFFSVPVGQERVCFNAHRIHAAETIREYFSGLELVEFSGVHDDKRFVERVDLTEFKQSEYACGMFWFRKPISDA